MIPMSHDVTSSGAARSAAVVADADIDPIAVNADSVTPIAPPLEAVPRLSNVLRAGLIPGVTATILCSLLWLIGWAFGTDFEVRGATGDSPMFINPLHIAVVALGAAMLFALAASLLRGRRGCKRVVLTIGYLAGLASLYALYAQPDWVTWPTKIWLALFHVITTLLVVPQVARVVGDSDPRATAGMRRTGLERA